MDVPQILGKRVATGKKAGCRFSNRRSPCRDQALGW
jgi:hypothetical protein